jgi:hypothetical protein
MAECNFCKAETQLYTSGVAICVKCSDEREAKSKPQGSDRQTLVIMHRELDAAKARASVATAAFNAVTSEIPSGIPHPDGTLRIHHASQEMDQSRVGLMIAHNRLNDFLSRGVVPDDLKQGS